IPDPRPSRSHSDIVFSEDRSYVASLTNPPLHSHSIVLGGFELISKTTRLIPRTSETKRDEILPKTSCGKRAQSAVIPSILVTALTATTRSYVLKSPITPTVDTGKSTGKACHTLPYRLASFNSSSTIRSAARISLR